MTAITEQLGYMRLHIQIPRLIKGDVQRSRPSRFTHQLGSISVLIHVTVIAISADNLTVLSIKPASDRP